MASRSENKAVAPVASRTLTAVRLVWLVAAAASLVLLALEVQATLAAAKHVCSNANTDCANLQITAQTVRALQSIGISHTLYVAYNIALLLLVNVAAYALAIALMARRSSDRMVMVTAFACLFVNLSSFQTPGGMWVEVTHVDYVLGQISVALFFFLFPSGRFVPRWSVLLAVGYTLSQFLASNAWWSFGLYVFFLLSIIALQVYRYRWVSTPLQRQQTKLVILGIGVFISAYVVAIAVYVVDSDLSHQPIPILLVQTVIDLAPLPLLLAAGFAVLRYRLWDADVLVNRSLVYASLTGTLAAVYAGSVVGLQALSQAVTGRQSDLAVAVSTLLIAALFNPLRHRIQDVIARTFYRRAYDAGRVLARFGETCRNETDLELLRGNLAHVIEDTMQPATVALWLRDMSPRAAESSGHRETAMPTAPLYS